MASAKKILGLLLLISSTCMASLSYHVVNQLEKEFTHACPPGNIFILTLFYMFRLHFMFQFWCRQTNQTNQKYLGQ